MFLMSVLVIDDGGGGSERSNLDGGRVDSSLNNVDSVDLNDDDDCDTNSLGSWKDAAENNLLASSKQGANGWCENDVGLASTSGGGGGGGLGVESPLVETPSHRMSWADMAQEDELEEEDEEEEGGCDLDKRMGDLDVSSGESKLLKVGEKMQLSREEREYMRFMKVRRQKDFICLEKIKGRIVNILAGLELHVGVFSAAEQKRIVEYIYELQEKGKKGEFNG